MAVYHGWNNTNELRSYPLDDAADRVASNGAMLPEDVLADMHIWMPASVGERAYIASAALTPSLITFTIAAYDDSTPLGAVTVLKPVDPFTVVNIDSQYPGFGGWAVVGSALNEMNSLSLIFDNPDATVIAAKALHPYDDIPLQSLGKSGNLTKLTGLVNLVAGRNVNIFAADEDLDEGDTGFTEYDILSNWEHQNSQYILQPKLKRMIGGERRRCIVVKLEGDAGSYDNIVGFSGPCAQNPQNNTCERLLINKINTVRPDCSGNIDIEVVGIDTVDYEEDGEAAGIVMQYPLGLTDVCQNDLALKYNGTGDLCDGYSSESSESSAESSSSGGGGPISCSYSLPYWDTLEGTGACWVEVGTGVVDKLTGLIEVTSAASTFAGAIRSSSASNDPGTRGYELFAKITPTDGIALFIFGWSALSDMKALALNVPAQKLQLVDIDAVADDYTVRNEITVTITPGVEYTVRVSTPASGTDVGAWLDYSYPSNLPPTYPDWWPTDDEIDDNPSYWAYLTPDLTASFLTSIAGLVGFGTIGGTASINDAVFLRDIDVSSAGEPSPDPTG